MSKRPDIFDIEPFVPSLSDSAAVRLMPHTSYTNEQKTKLNENTNFLLGSNIIFGKVVQ